MYGMTMVSISNIYVILLIFLEVAILLVLLSVMLDWC